VWILLPCPEHFSGVVLKYIATKSFSIEQTNFERGDIVGTGNVGAGQFAPVESASFVQCGHIEPRLAVGLIEEVKETPASKPVQTTPAQKPARTKKTKGK